MYVYHLHDAGISDFMYHDDQRDGFDMDYFNAHYWGYFIPPSDNDYK